MEKNDKVGLTGKPLQDLADSAEALNREIVRMVSGAGINPLYTYEIIAELYNMSFETIEQIIKRHVILETKIQRHFNKMLRKKISSRNLRFFKAKVAFIRARNNVNDEQWFKNHPNFEEILFGKQD